MLSIKNNIMAGNAARHLSTGYDALSTSVERLSSGQRINSAKDDAAGMAVRELMRADIAVLGQGARNAQDGISMLQTMEGAMGVIDENLIRMKELAEQAATGSYSDDQRKIMNQEFAQMAAEIDRIAGNTSFNGLKMLNSDTGSMKIHVGSDETIDIDNVDMTTKGLGVEAGAAGYGVTFNDTVADTDTAAYFTVAGQAATVNVTFDDGGEAEKQLSVDFAVGTYTLDDVADAINTASQNLGNDADGNSLDYKAAEVVGDETSGYALKINSSGTGADGVTAEVAGIAGTDFNIGATDVLDDAGPTNLLTANATAAANTGVNIETAEAAKDALDQIGAAIVEKDASRAAFGYKMNRLESVSSILGIQIENLQSSESRVSDVDVATEMANMTKNQVLAQAGISMLGQANGMPQMALSLLG